jgi:hypothetical protein
VDLHSPLIGSMHVLINGVPGPPIMHACGLRQGNTLSLMIFTLVIDVLNSLIHRVVQRDLLQRLTPRHAASGVWLYPDDVANFLPPG